MGTPARQISCGNECMHAGGGGGGVACRMNIMRCSTSCLLLTSLCRIALLCVTLPQVLLWLQLCCFAWRSAPRSCSTARGQLASRSMTSLSPQGEHGNQSLQSAAAVNATHWIFLDTLHAAAVWTAELVQLHAPRARSACDDAHKPVNTVDVTMPGAAV